MFFWWMRWRDVGCGGIVSMYECVRHIVLDLSYDTAALLFWRVLRILFLTAVYLVPGIRIVFFRTLHIHTCRMASIMVMIKK